MLAPSLLYTLKPDEGLIIQHHPKYNLFVSLLLISYYSKILKKKKKRFIKSWRIDFVVKILSHILIVFCVRGFLVGDFFFVGKRERSCFGYNPLEWTSESSGVKRRSKGVWEEFLDPRRFLIRVCSPGLPGSRSTEGTIVHHPRAFFSLHRPGRHGNYCWLIAVVGGPAAGLFRSENHREFIKSSRVNAGLMHPVQILQNSYPPRYSLSVLNCTSSLYYTYARTYMDRVDFFPFFGG